MAVTLVPGDKIETEAFPEIVNILDNCWIGKGYMSLFARGDSGTEYVWTVPAEYMVTLL